MFKITLLSGTVSLSCLLVSCSLIEKISEDQEKCEQSAIQRLYQPNSYRRTSGFEELIPDENDKDFKFVTWNFKETNQYGTSIENQARCTLRKETYDGKEFLKSNDFHVWGIDYKR